MINQAERVNSNLDRRDPNLFSDGNSSLVDFLQKQESVMSLSESLQKELLAVGLHPEVVVCVKEEWSSQNEDYRLNIRRDLYDKVSPKHDIEKQKFEDLSTIPEDARYHISISHCRSFGGYVYLPKTHIIGFDVECLERVTPRIAARISNTKDQFDTVVNPGFIWVAKEAAFKALQYVIPIRLIQEVIIDSWSMRSANVFEFHTGNFDKEKSIGCVIFEANSAFAFYQLDSESKGRVYS